MNPYGALRHRRADLGLDAAFLGEDPVELPLLVELDRGLLELRKDKLLHVLDHRFGRINHDAIAHDSFGACRRGLFLVRLEAVVGHREGIVGNPLIQ
jgi:hypothetical protein